MIQRIQSLWFLLAAMMLLGLLLIPIVKLDILSTDLSYTLTAGTLKEILHGKLLRNFSLWWVNISVIITATYVLCMILLYKNRTLQIALSYVGIIVIVMMYFILAQAVKNIFYKIDLHANNYTIACLFPSVAIAFILFAIRAIRKDENLIKAADRLR